METGAARGGTMQPEDGAPSSGIPLNLGLLRVFSIVLPAAFVAAVVALTSALSGDVPEGLRVGIIVLVVTAAATLFSGVVFHVIERAEAGLRERNEAMAAVQAAATSLASQFELHAVLERFVELSCEITGARYGAMSVLRPDGMIQEFITTGLTDEERARIGPPPVGHGLLGVIIREGRALRLDDLTRDPRSQGFPPHHPPMTSLLGVPVISRGETIGNLYLTDKIDAPGFSDADEEMVRTFANYAAVAVETSRLQDELRSLAVVTERERIGMDLHDGIIQSIYAVGLSLDGAADDVTANPDAARRALDDAIDRLNAVIRDVRSYIFELRPARLSDDLAQSLHDLTRNFQVNSLIETSLEVPESLPALSEDQRRAIFHVAQEALVNARKHAKATQAAVTLRSIDGELVLEVSDNGTGFDVSEEQGDDHRGLRNMSARAKAAGGTIRFESRPGAGTTVRAQFPATASEATEEQGP